MAKQIHTMTFPGAAGFELSAVHRLHSREKHYYQLNHHCHQRCEIYVNLSGNVAFAVEGQIYPISCGDIVITRPYEYHHCIYRGDAIHEYYWILFTCKGNEPLLTPFFDRPMGTGNRIRLSPEERQAFLAHCSALTGEPLPTADRMFHFWGMLRLLESGRAEQGKTDRKDYPEPLKLAMHYLEECIGGPVPVCEMAQAAHVSVNTVERLFRQYTGMTPAAYTKNRRLQAALVLLEQGHNITETAMATGFCDSSYFILQFKRKYGVTPYQYQRSMSSER